MPGVLENEYLAPDPTRPVIVAAFPAVLENAYVAGARGAVWWFEETTERAANRTLDSEQKGTRTFQAMTDSQLTSSIVVIQFDQMVTPFFAGSPGSEFNGKSTRKVPRPGDPYVELNETWDIIHTNEFVVCVNISVRQSNPDNLREWTITAEYAGVNDPVLQPAEVSWGQTPYQESGLEEPTDTTGPYTNRPYLNSAKDPFAEGVIVDKDRMVVTISKNVVEYQPVEAAKYQNTLNLTTAFAAQHPPGFPPGTCKIKLTAVRLRRGNNSSFYWKVTAVVEVNELGWDAKLRDAGFNYLNNLGKKLPMSQHPNFIARGAPATAQLLKPNGDLADPAADVPAPLSFRRYVHKDWAALAVILNY